MDVAPPRLFGIFLKHSEPSTASAQQVGFLGIFCNYAARWDFLKLMGVALSLRTQTRQMGYRSVGVPKLVAAMHTRQQGQGHLQLNPEVHCSAPPNDTSRWARSFCLHLPGTRATGL